MPSVAFAEDVTERRRTASGTPPSSPSPLAGHRTVLPGESPVTAGAVMQRGGSPEADAELGRLAWPHVVSALGLHPA